MWESFVYGFFGGMARLFAEYWWIALIAFVLGGVSSMGKKH